MTTLSAQQARVRTIKAELRDLAAQAARTFWQAGLLFNEVKEHELWRADDARTFHAWVESVGYKRETARKLMHIARHFSAEAAARYGQEKLFAAVALIEATAKEELPGDL